MFTAKKIYTDIPFAHRQHKHDGHCSFVHGPNWSIALTFACKETDPSGFVVDFGKLKFLKAWIEENLDHACLFNEDDPLKDQLIDSAPGCWKTYVLPNCSCEGIAEHLYSVFNEMVMSYTKGRVKIIQVEIIEDSKNSSIFTPDLS